jgi:hypothetical protein
LAAPEFVVVQQEQVLAAKTGSAVVAIYLTDLVLGLAAVAVVVLAAARDFERGFGTSPSGR